jgi:excisionase family DNA binding protein
MNRQALSRNVGSTEHQIEGIDRGRADRQGGKHDADDQDMSRTGKLVVSLQDQVGNLVAAVRSLERRIPARLVSVEETAQHLSISVQTVRRWCKTGLLPYVRRGRELRIDLSKVQARGPEDIRRLAE